MKTNLLRHALFWYPHRLALLCVALVGIPSWFYYSDVITKGIQAAANFRVNPSFTGGLPSARFFDPVGDDFGPGTLAYPTHDAFVPGSLDIVRYTVYAPVHGGTWSASSEYWQVVLAFAGSGGAGRNMRIYIDTDGTASGRSAPLDERAEGVVFDPDHPWDWRIALSGDAALFESADGSLSIPAEVYEGNGGKEVTIRVPLEDRRLHFLYALPTAWHYVLLGAWTPWGADGFAPVSRRASSGTGGGSTSPFTPKLYDLLDAPERAQTVQLSAWNEHALSRPVVYPVEVSMAPMDAPKKRSADEALLARLEGEAAAEAARERTTKAEAFEEAKAAYDPGNESALRDLALAAFGAGEHEEAGRRFGELLTRNPDDAEALAYRGSLIALKAKEENPLTAVETVARAYAALDRACLLAQTSRERLAAFLNRASVSRAVPDIVFGKALSGAADYLESAALLETGLETARLSVLRAEALLGAAICFETAGRTDEAETWFRETERIVGELDESLKTPNGGEARMEPGNEGALPGLSAIRLELARRGISISPP